MTPQIIGKFRVERVVESEGPFAALDFLLPGVPPELVEQNAEWLMPTFIDPADRRVIMSFHSYVLRTPRYNILVDACVGNDKERPERPMWHRQRGPYLDRLAQAGLQPEQIDFVFCTHLHADHVGWNTQLVDGRWVPTFPNARYVFARREYEHWERAHREARARGLEVINHGSFADSVLPIMDAGRAVLVNDDHEIDDGVFLEPAHGHTAGTCVLHAADGDGHGLFTGDILHTAVQFARPSLSSRFCDDPIAAASVRAALCERYAETATTIFSGHFPSPTAGRIVRHRDAFRFAM